VEKHQPGVTAQADDARLLGSPAADAAAAGPEVDASNVWRSLLEEQLRWVCAFLLRLLPPLLLLLWPVSQFSSVRYCASHACNISWMHQLPIRVCLHWCPCRCGLVLVDVEIPLVALADGVHSRSFSGARLLWFVSYCFLYFILV
jgi:hypothetical protein